MTRYADGAVDFAARQSAHLGGGHFQHETPEKLFGETLGSKIEMVNGIDVYRTF